MSACRSDDLCFSQYYYVIDASSCSQGLCFKHSLKIVVILFHKVYDSSKCPCLANLICFNFVYSFVSFEWGFLLQDFSVLSRLLQCLIVNRHFQEFLCIHEKALNIFLDHLSPYAGAYS